MAHLQGQAKALKSDALSALMIRMQEDHFVKVRTMIKDMIAKLEADTSAEADQKAWCDEEMTKAMKQRDVNTGEIEGDTAAKTEADAKAIQLKEEIAGRSMVIFLIPQRIFRIPQRIFLIPQSIFLNPEIIF